MMWVYARLGMYICVDIELRQNECPYIVSETTTTAQNAIQKKTYNGQD